MLPKRLDRKVVLESKWVNHYIDRVQKPSGKVDEEQHYFDYPREAVIVLATNKENKVCFIKSLRYVTQREEWEIPAGGIDDNEEILEAAKREFIEETGYEVENTKIQYSFNPSNGMSNQLVHFVRCNITNAPQKEFDTDEVKEVFWLSKEKIQELIYKNEIYDGISLLPLLFFLNEN